MGMNAEFWQKYKTIVAGQIDSPKAIDWYLRWAKKYEGVLPEKPLIQRTQEDVQAYIELLPKQNSYEDWQLKQANDAFRILFAEYLDLPWARPWPIYVNNPSSGPNSVKNFALCI